MSSWGNTDDAANSVIWATASVNLISNTQNQTNLYGNTTMSAFITGAEVGQFGADTTEMGVANGSIVEYVVTNPGSGYFANATVTVSGNGTANAHANSIGKIDQVKVVLSGNSYSAKPTVTVAAPTAQTINSNTALFIASSFNANSAVDGSAEFITVASNPYVNNDVVVYTVAAGNTALTNLANAASYYVVGANSTGVKLSLTSNGAAIDLTKGATETGHTLTRRTGGFISVGSNVYQVDDLVTYTVAAGNTTISGLANGSTYSVVAANSSGIKLSSTPGGAAISVVPGVSETGHTLTGQTATAQAVISGASGKGFHAGWVLRTVGSGGRAGRVNCETLVAMGSIGTDGSDDSILKDS
jgi:hypothetical protein